MGAWMPVCANASPHKGDVPPVGGVSMLGTPEWRASRHGNASWGSLALAEPKRRDRSGLEAASRYFLPQATPAPNPASYTTSLIEP